MARKKRAEESSAGSPWLNTFADLMNLLLCFFVLLFASSTVDADKYEQIVTSMSGSFSIFSGGGSAIENGMLISTGIKQLDKLDDYEETASDAVDEGDNSGYLEEYLAEQKESTEKLYDKIVDLADKSNISDNLQISVDPSFQYVKFSLNGSILFDSGKAELKTEAVPLFSKIGDILRIYKGYHIEIEGHTDNVPINNSNYSSNNWLSSARALNVAMYLIDEKGLDPKTLSWTGRGEYDPVASNGTEEGRKKNRRVEIKIYNDIYVK